MWNFLKRKKDKNPLRFKKLTSFSNSEILCIDDLLFTFYQNGANYHGINKFVSGNNYGLSFQEVNSLMNFLLDFRYVHGSVNSVTISTKGKITCEQGGLYLIYEKQKTQNFSKWISIISAIVAVSALIANILFSYLKECP